MKLDAIELPYYVMEIFDILYFRGYGAFVVGGCCRDILLGRKPHDYDIATSALPEEMIEIFESCGLKTIPTGLQHGTVTVIIDDNQVECTTYRIDGEYSDGRRPDKVTFAYSIEDDLMRRDFTMNAIAYNPWNGLVDPFGGAEDIKNKIIRCVGKPENRFKEDGLRILRAIRFAAQLGFEIDDDTSKAIHNQKHLLDNISKERIQNELCKILMSDNGGKVLKEYRDVLYQIVPEFKNMNGFIQEDHYYENKDMLEHTLYCLDSNRLRFDKEESWNDIVLRLAILFHDIGKPYCCGVDERGVQTFEGHANVSAKMTYRILKDLKFSNEIVGYTTQLVSYHEFNFDNNIHPKIAVKRLLNEIGEVQLRRLIALQKCDLSGQYLILTDKRRIDFVLMAENCIDEILDNGECYSLKQLAINGEDLIEIGFEQGKEVGKVLKMLLEMVMRGELDNNREDILEIAKSIKYNIIFE